MQKLTYALVGLLFIPASVFAPIAHARTVDEDVSGEEPSPIMVAVDPSAVTEHQVRLTSYNAVAGQTDSNPHVTASGAASNPEVIAARSRDLAADLPYGTVIAIYREGSDSYVCNFSKVEHLIGYRVVADTMNARFTKRVDVELDRQDTVTYQGRELNPSKVLGVCGGTTVRVIGRIPLSKIPATQAELARIVGHSLIATADSTDA